MQGSTLHLLKWIRWHFQPTFLFLLLSIIFGSNIRLDYELSLDLTNFVFVGINTLWLLLSLQLIREKLMDISLLFSFIEFSCPPSLKLAGKKMKTRT